MHPLLIAGGAGCLLLVDVLACTLRRVPLAGLPLLTIYSVPVSMTGESPHWLLYTLTAIGFLAMIFLSESEQIARWGPILAEDHGHSEPKPLAVPSWPRTGARAIGGVATALSVVVPVLIPTFSVHLFDFGPGTGGDDDISIENPMVDLKRDLIRGEDRTLVTLTTDDPDPRYLRIAVLNRFNDNEWSSGDREVPSSQTADGTMPGLVGVSSELTRHKYDYELQGAREFRSSWLPTTQLVSRVDAPGDWRYDVSTMDFLASNDDLDTSQLNWTFGAVKVDYDVNRLAEAPPVGALVSRDFIDLPEGLDPIVRQIALQVTADAPSRYEKAVALQQWFRDEGGFTYSTDVNLGNGTDDLVRFLLEGDGGRTGYCEQFAAAMAVMARELGIPARVAVGFLEPEQVDDDTYVYSSHDLHAWPELFFSGSGWVRFEPTPSTRASGVPSYTEQEVSVGNPDASPTATGAGAGDEPTRCRTTPCPRRHPRTRRPASPTAVASPGCGWSARSCWCSPWPWSHSARGRCAGAAATSAACSAQRTPGRSFATPRSTCGCRGRSTDRHGRPARRWSSCSARRATSSHRSGRAAAPTPTRTPSSRWTGSCTRSSGSATPATTAARPAPGAPRCRPASRRSTAAPPSAPAASPTGGRARCSTGLSTYAAH